ncbi:uncharacterized protein GLRG_02055 [Colletotrichum graminicola M1.001]|uniref:Uncharacterized protein n=1 Tax=Colletotrichum graminicola (strain M1.001 / M2 / FGSC 10212) TaxID=645133 RepID=E3Q8L3_COLGM|nr:uncharacterized protein GLRG_02055 [Colletotrichum graminicola M1.001]EFQ26884.1 hypothetical protein GLRG_02055 [Colletotrichum graminicola M1.001]
MIDISLDVRQVSRDLTSRWQRYGTRFEYMWRSFSPEDRTEILNVANPTLVGQELDFAPHWDNENMAEDPSVLVNILRHRATATLPEQAFESSVNGPSDLEVIKESQQYIDWGLPRGNAYVAFCEGEKYGVPHKAADQKTVAAALLPPGKEHLCVPVIYGDLVLLRQAFIIGRIGTAFMLVWDCDPEEQPGPWIPANPEESAARLREALQLQEPAGDAVDDSALNMARRNKGIVGAQWGSLGVATRVLKERVIHYFSSLPDQVLNEDRVTNNTVVDKDLITCVYDVVNDVARHHALWTYLVAVMPEAAEEEEGGPGRAVILQEMAHVCHMGFQRAQSLLKRFLQKRLEIKEGEKALFVKRCGEYDVDGNTLVTLAVSMDKLDKVKPRIDPSIRHIVRLCQPETTAEAAFEWLQKLKDECEIDTEGLGQLKAWEADALADLATMLTFIEKLTDEAALPPVNGKKRVKGLFVSKCQQIDKDLWALRDKVDLTLFAVPPARLGKPEVAAGALDTISNVCRQKTGSSLEGNYDKAVRESVSELRRRCAQAQAKQQKGKAAAAAPAGPSLFIDKAQGKRDEDEQQQERKEKVKTRPAEGAEAELVPPAPPTPPPPAQAPEPEKIKVTAATADVFEALFDRTLNRRPIAFTALESAMAELGFTVDSHGGVGSSTKFVPPKGSGWRPVTLHRPHGNANKLEGYRLLTAASRFREHFGWDAETFEVV